MSTQPLGVDEDTKETLRELTSMCSTLQSDVRELQEDMEEKDERIQTLEAKKNAHKARLDAYQKKINRIEDILVGEKEELADDKFDMADAIWTQIQEAKEISENSLAIAKSSSKREENITKKEVATTLSRDETVISSIRTSQKAGAVDCGEVKDMAKPDTRLAHRTILDAWNELEAEWEAFEVIKREGPDNQERKMLRCYSDRLTPVLVRTVKNNLSDPEATESLNSWLGSEGVR